MAQVQSMQKKQGSVTYSMDLENEVRYLLYLWGSSGAWERKLAEVKWNIQLPQMLSFAYMEPLKN